MLIWLAGLLHLQGALLIVHPYVFIIYMNARAGTYDKRVTSLLAPISKYVPRIISL